jgi:transcriptional regulator with XRE-family HTH domain
MAINIGPLLRKRREWARVTQQELVDHTRLDRSASYISALETGKTSPTLAELERLASYFRTDVIELLEEATEVPGRAGVASSSAGPPPDDRLQRLYDALDPADQALALEFLELLLRQRRRD